ncbi:hypothetical protein GGX14DRAFT_408245 [Mycena pura]|uniref:Uncharacterized protein n=1 Tax=Mycena pura TaxID=153505 RepID=A0AAD6Y3K2_9AGAR|nr:hypothetical protein GGX14DRAFT_408245 [Mycena pura]
MSFYSPDIPTKRSYKRIPDLVIPEIPPLQSASTSASVPTTPITPISSTSTSSQPRRRNPTDLTVTINRETGRMSTDWYTEEEFADVLAAMGDPEEHSDEEDAEDAGQNDIDYED